MTPGALIARIDALCQVRDRLISDLIRAGVDPEFVMKRAAEDYVSPREARRRARA